MRKLVSQYFHTVFGFCNKTVKKGVFCLLRKEQKPSNMFVPHNCVVKHIVAIANMRQESRSVSLIFYVNSSNLAVFLQANIL